MIESCHWLWLRSSSSPSVVVLGCFSSINWYDSKTCPGWDVLIFFKEGYSIPGRGDFSLSHRVSQLVSSRLPIRMCPVRDPGSKWVNGKSKSGPICVQFLQSDREFWRSMHSMSSRVLRQDVAPLSSTLETLSSYWHTQERSKKASFCQSNRQTSWENPTG